MIARINCVIAGQNVDILRRVVYGGSVDVEIEGEGHDEYTALVKVRNKSQSADITNEPSVQEDGDEYPMMVVSTDVGYEWKSNRCVTGASVKKLTLIRDTVEWKRDNSKWVVQADIGMKFYLESKEILLIAADSVGGLIEYTEGESVPVKTDIQALKEHWIFKRDEFLSAKREEIDIHAS